MVLRATITTLALRRTPVSPGFALEVIPRLAQGPLISATKPVPVKAAPALASSPTRPMVPLATMATRSPPMMFALEGFAQELPISPAMTGISVLPGMFFLSLGFAQGLFSIAPPRDVQ